MEFSISRSRLVLLAAVAAVPLLAMATPVRAQFPVDNSRANDANNRIGSGGYNTGPIPAQETVTGNDIVTGNVTAGKAFRGPVGYRGPNDFAGPSATANYDRFIQNSSGAQVSFNRTPTNFANNVLPFYSSVATPPSDFVRTSGNYGFIPEVDVQHRVHPTRFDERLGVMTNLPQDSIIPAPGQLLIPGPVDPKVGQTYISASPLTGVRQVSASDPATLSLIAGSLNSNGRAGLSDDQIMRMRRELNQTLATPDLNAPSDQGQAAPGLNQSLNAAPKTSFEAPETGALTAGPLNNSLGSTANDLSTGQDSVNRMVGTPSQQSSQYAEMRRRLDRYNAEQRPKTAEERNVEFQAQRREAEARQKQAGVTAPQKQGTVQQPAEPRKLEVPEYGKKAQDIAEGRAPAGAEGPKPTDKTYIQTPSGGVTAYVPTTPDRQPVEVRSLATGVSAPGLRTLLQQAETNMQQGKFDSAIGQYESAAQVAPNNPLVLLGQANAELGGEYFARAENHLRQSFLLDPTLLMARYDLRSMMGDKRLDQVINSLKQIASKENNQYSPAFLLSYIAYNSHDPERAASYLDLAEKRAAAPDPVFRLLRSHWNLPAAAPAPATQNK